MMPLGEAVEMIRVKVAKDKAEQFLSERAGVDAALREVGGHVGTEIVQVGEEDFVFLIRWVDEAAVRAAQVITEKLPAISTWLERAEARFVSFETSVVRYAFRAGER
jgi:antibiotic biosynthesis monooxygenase (ABM) superfamily enzyme